MRHLINNAALSRLWLCALFRIHMCNSDVSFCALIRRMNTCIRKPHTLHTMHESPSAPSANRVPHFVRKMPLIHMSMYRPEGLCIMCTVYPPTPTPNEIKTERIMLKAHCHACQCVNIASRSTDRLHTGKRKRRRRSLLERAVSVCNGHIGCLET
jgi:hypothetical protein